MFKVPLLVAWFPFLLPALTQHLWNLPCWHRFRSLPSGHWQLVGKPPGQPRVMKPTDQQENGPVNPQVPTPPFLPLSALKVWQEKSPAATDCRAFPGRCSCSCSWWPFSYPPGLGQVRDHPHPQKIIPIPYSLEPHCLGTPQLSVSGHIFECPGPDSSVIK